MNKQSAEYLGLHRDLVERGFKWVGYFYTGDLSGVCECKKVGLAHNFVLRSDKAEEEGVEIVLGSSCINKNQLYNYIFSEKPETWKNLQDELKQYKELFRLIKGSVEYKNKKVTLDELRSMKAERKDAWQKDREARAIRTAQLLDELEAYAWKTGYSFVASLLDQANNGRVLSDRQLEVFEKIETEYNEKNNTEIDEVLAEYKAQKNQVHFEDDFFTVSYYLRMARFDAEFYRDTLRVKSNLYVTLYQFSDAQADRAERIIFKYRKQLGQRFWKIANTAPEHRSASDLLYVEAYNRLVSAEILPIIPKSEYASSEIEGYSPNDPISTLF